MKNSIKTIIEHQKDFFNSGKILDINFRKKKLIELKKEIQKNEKEIELALYKDLGKSSGESFLTEIHFIYAELNIAIKNINKWTRRKSVRPSLLNYPSSDYIIPQP